MKKPKRVSKKALALLRLKSGKVTMAKTGNIESYDGMLVLKGLRSPFATSDEGLVETKVRKIPHCKFCGKPRKGHPKICPLDPRSKSKVVPVQVLRSRPRSLLLRSKECNVCLIASRRWRVGGAQPFTRGVAAVMMQGQHEKGKSELA